MSRDELARDLGPIGAATVGIGATLGAGIFVLPSIAAARTEAALWLPFALAGALAIVNAALIAELSTALPRSGGSYGWVRRSLGPLAATVVGLANWAGTAVATAFYCVGFGIYVGLFVPLPEGWLFGFTLAPERSGALLAAFAILAANYLGVRNAGRGAIALVGTLVAILLAFVAGSAAAIGAEDLLAAISSAETVGSVDGLAGVTALVFASYLGYAKLSALAGEVRDPDRTLPRAIVGSVLAVCVLYVGLAIVLEAAVDLATLAETDRAIVAVAASLYGFRGVAVIGLAGVLATVTSAGLSISSAARVGYAMGADGLAPSAIESYHDRFATPHRALQATAIPVLALAAVADLVTLALLATALHLVVAACSSAALLVVQTSVDSYEPPFSAPFSRAIAVVSIAGAIVLLSAIDAGVLLATVGFVGIAVGWYVVYGRDRGREREPLEAFLRRRSERVAGEAGTQSSRPDVGSAEDRRSAAETGESVVRGDGTDGERAIEGRAADRAGETVLLPLSNPRTERNLVELGCAVARARGANVVAIHVVQVPEQTPLRYAAERADEPSRRLLADAERHADPFDVPFESYTVFSHRSVEEVFEAARRHGATLTVMGWRRGTPFAGRAESIVDELAHDLPCDFLVLDDRGFDPSRILVPTAGTEHDVLGAELARTLADAFDAEVTLLHVVDGESERGGGNRFLRDWRDAHDLECDLVVDVSGDVEAAIEEHARDNTLLVVGATDRGLLSRLVRRALVLDVVEDVDCSVVLAERPTGRSVRERLFG